MESRVWIYPANRELKSSETEKIAESLEQFCREWTAHDVALTADFEIIDNRFILLSVDETKTGASGCSIDKSVRRLKEIGLAFDVNFFDHSSVYYEKNGHLHQAHFSDIQNLYDTGVMNESVLVYNNQFMNLEDLRNNFKVPFRDHWIYKRISRK